MRRSRSALRMALGVLVITMARSDAARAGGGTITLDELMDQLQDNQTLISEIFTQLKAQQLKAESIICVGYRFSGQWLNLGGARAVPYECEVGKRKLNIEGSVHVYDDAGTELDLKDEKSFERATEYGQADLTWKWQ